MKPLIVLLVVFCVAVFSLKLTTAEYNFPLSARIAMCAMLMFTAIGHFAFAKGMLLMVPDFIPFKKEVVFLSGVFEMATGIGLLIPGLSVYTGWILIIFFILMLPANIKAAIKRIDYQKATYNGNGPNYLWFRIPLQIFFIIWVYVSAIRH